MEKSIKLNDAEGWVVVLGAVLEAEVDFDLGRVAVVLPLALMERAGFFGDVVSLLVRLKRSGHLGWSRKPSTAKIASLGISCLYLHPCRVKSHSPVRIQ